ncbi:hypothetical protein M405DRAFT_855796 [Rhizopogon salebrosus TDB-379]|nr:hypothetical protein M405DRAFT_855796 [Rhizopogon salebrosus TDB-379]
MSERRDPTFPSTGTPASWSDDSMREDWPRVVDTPSLPVMERPSFIPEAKSGDPGDIYEFYLLDDRQESLRAFSDILDDLRRHNRDISMSHPPVPEFDIIFAGGGTTACVVAGRLAACDPSLKILILEAGPHTLNKAAHVQPYLYPTHMARTSTTVTFNIGNPSPHLNGRTPVVPCGRCVGGGSSVNCS